MEWARWLRRRWKTWLLRHEALKVARNRLFWAGLAYADLSASIAQRDQPAMDTSLKRLGEELRGARIALEDATAERVSIPRARNSRMRSMGFLWYRTG
jgi:hypothetical protein